MMAVHSATSGAETRKRRFWLAARLLSSAAAIAWVVHTTDLSAVVRALIDADTALLILGVLLNVSTRFAAAERTQVMNQGLGLSVSRWQTIETLFISNFYSLLSPGPVLSGVVTVYRYKSYGATITGSVSSLLASRAVECAAFLFWGLLCAMLDARVLDEMQRAAPAPTSIAMVTVILLAVLTVAWLALRKHRFDKLHAVWTQIISQGPLVAARAALPASLQVLVSGAAMMILARSLHTDLSWATGIWLSAAVYAAVLLPISIAGLGVREVTLIKSFALLGLAPRTAVALSVLLFLDQFVSALIGGALQIGSVLTRARQSP